METNFSKTLKKCREALSVIKKETGKIKKTDFLRGIHGKLSKTKTHTDDVITVVASDAAGTLECDYDIIPSIILPDAWTVRLHHNGKTVLTTFFFIREGRVLLWDGRYDTEKDGECIEDENHFFYHVQEVDSDDDMREKLEEFARIRQTKKQQPADETE